MNSEEEDRVIFNTLMEKEDWPDECLIKPPLGLTPRWLHDSHRVGEIPEAFSRYLESLSRYNEAGKPVPQEWFDKLNEKIKKEATK